MNSAIGSYCGDFPQPEDPFEGTAFSSDLTSSSSSAYDSTEHRPPTPTTTPDTTGGTSTDGYDSDLYAPGAGQDPAPAPAPNGNGPDGTGPPGQTSGGTG